MKTQTRKLKRLWELVVQVGWKISTLPDCLRACSQIFAECLCPSVGPSLWEQVIVRKNCLQKKKRVEKSQNVVFRPICFEKAKMPCSGQFFLNLLAVWTGLCKTSWEASSVWTGLSTCPTLPTQPPALPNPTPFPQNRPPGLLLLLQSGWAVRSPGGRTSQPAKNSQTLTEKPFCHCSSLNRRIWFLPCFVFVCLKSVLPLHTAYW